MKNYFKIIEEKIKLKVKLEKLEIVDNSINIKDINLFLPERYHIQINFKVKILKFNLKIRSP